MKTRRNLFGTRNAMNLVRSIFFIKIKQCKILIAVLPTPEYENTIKVIKYIIEGSHKHLDTHEILFLFKELLRSYGLLKCSE